MTAQELFRIVKDFPVVWCDLLTYQTPECRWATTHDKHAGWPVHPIYAEIILEALFARASACGASESDEGIFTFDDKGNFPSIYEPCRLVAFVNAWREGEKK